MDEYIKWQTVMDCLIVRFEYLVSLQEYITAIFDKLQKAPSEDVVKVIRCKDCNDYQTKFRWCKLHDVEMQPTDFCSKGERRDG